LTAGRREEYKSAWKRLETEGKTAFGFRAVSNAMGMTEALERPWMEFED
jgi:hypothetical protein